MCTPNRVTPTFRAVTKYEPLARHLADLPAAQGRVVLTFRRVEEILGESFPASARRYEDWWDGGRKWTRLKNAQVQERAWHSAGWTVEDISLPLGLVTFRRQT